MQQKILLIAPQPFYQNRGTPINVKAMAETLSNANFQVDLLVYPFGENIEIAGVKLIRTWGLFGIKSVPIGASWKKVMLDISMSFKALTLACKNRYLLFHGVEEAGFIAYVLAIIFSRRCIFDMDSCMLSQLQESGFIQSPWLLKLLGKFEAHCIKNSSAVITVCQALTEKVKEFAPQALIAQIEDFPPANLERFDAKLLSELQAKYKSAQQQIIVYTGNFEPYQGIQLLLDALSELTKVSEQDKNLLLLLVGGEAQQIAALRLVITNLGIEQYVTLTGPKPAAEMGAYLNLADVLVSPRLNGTNTPLKLYGYMAVAKPIVATKILSHTQVLTEENAYLAEPNSKDFAAALRQALDQSPSARATQRLKANFSKQLVESRYSRATFVQKLQNLYSELLSQ